MGFLRMGGRASVLWVAIGLWLARPAAGVDAEVQLRVAGAVGEPGEEVALEFRADAAVPLVDVSVHFSLPGAPVELVRVSVEGTAAAHVIPGGIIFDPRFFKGGYRCGVRMIAQTQRSRIGPGDDIILFKAIFRVGADAPTGDYGVEVLSTDFAGEPRGTTTVSVNVQETGSLRVAAPTRPRPVDDVSCEQSRAEVVVRWSVTEPYDAIRVMRGEALVETLPGSATELRDQPPPGPTTYSVQALQGAAESLVAHCSLQVDIPRPLPIEQVVCTTGTGIVSLAWKNGEPYDVIEVLRNGRLLTTLPGSATSYTDAWDADLFTVYSLRAGASGVMTLPVQCSIHEFSDTFEIWAEEVRAAPGSMAVPVRLFITNPKVLLNLQVGLRVDPTLARMSEVSIAGTASEAAQYDYFAYQPFFIPGETGLGILFDTIPPYGFPFPAGAEQHFVTVLVDVPPSLPDGTVVPVQFGTFGRPGINASVGVKEGKTAVSTTLRTRDGAILVGASPIPEVVGARAEVLEGDPPPSPGAIRRGGNVGRGVSLEWQNAITYSGIRVDRDGEVIATLPGDAVTHVDKAPGPGIHHYRIIARKGDLQSFPVSLTTLPQGVPGTFICGDVDGDGIVRLTDCVALLEHLHDAAVRPRCLDAADANDDGSLGIPDALRLLSFLFLGGGPLRPPGPEAPWFDVTPDALTCE